MMFEIGNAIADELGRPYSNAIIPYARTVRDLGDGSADIVLRFTNPELEKNSIQVAPIVSMPTIIVGLSGTAIKSLADLTASP